MKREREGGGREMQKEMLKRSVYENNCNCPKSRMKIWKESFFLLSLLKSLHYFQVILDVLKLFS